MTTAGPLLVDTHAHLQADAFDADRDKVVARASAAGVGRVVVPGIDLASCEAALALAAREPMVSVAVGIHPSEAHATPPDYLARLCELARRPGVVAIGEIGLDFYRGRQHEATQRRVLREQLELAGELGLPAIVHNRDGDEELLALLGAWVRRSSDNRAVLHSFAGDADIAARAIEAGLYLGVGGIATFPRSDALRGAIAAMPPERLVVETDSPYLAPQPVRGRRNEPAYVAHVVAYLARVRGVSPQELAERTTGNAIALFGFGERSAS